MQLQPCARCRRHVLIEASRCPFCWTELRPALATRVLQHGGRLSRAAVFAGAAACYTSTPPPQHVGPPPPPPDEQVQQAAPPPPDGDGAGSRTFAEPPPGALASVRGVVRQGSLPLAGIRVQLYRGSDATVTTTDDHGRYRFAGVEPGSYRVIADVPSGGRFQSPQRQIQVELAAGADERVDFEVPMPQRVDHGPCCKPYGAPPARRRVV